MLDFSLLPSIGFLGMGDRIKDLKVLYQWHKWFASILIENVLSVSICYCIILLLKFSNWLARFWSLFLFKTLWELNGTTSSIWKVANLIKQNFMNTF